MYFSETLTQLHPGTDLSAQNTEHFAADQELPCVLMPGKTLVHLCPVVLEDF